MAGRYLITGVQLGMLRTLPDKERIQLLVEIEKDQFVSNSEREIRKDCIILYDCFTLLTKYDQLKK